MTQNYMGAELRAYTFQRLCTFVINCLQRPDKCKENIGVSHIPGLLVCKSMIRLGLGAGGRAGARAGGEQLGRQPLQPRAGGARWSSAQPAIPGPHLNRETQHNTVKPFW